MKSRDPVSSIMSPTVKCVNVGDDVSSALDIMRENNIRHVPVLKGKEVVGIISMADLKWMVSDQMPEDLRDQADEFMDRLKISEVMTRSPYMVSSTSRIKEVAEVFAKEPFHAMPVVDGETLTGIVTTTDVINHLLSE